MKDFFDLFQTVLKDERTTKAAKDGIDNALKALDKAQEWLAKIPEDKFNKAVETVGERSRRNLADGVRSGKIDKEFLKKVHRIKMMFPSDITRELEKVFNSYYDEYKGKTK
jgi:hypothetical protein